MTSANRFSGERTAQIAVALTFALIASLRIPGGGCTDEITLSAFPRAPGPGATAPSRDFAARRLPSGARAAR